MPKPTAPSSPPAPVYALVGDDAFLQAEKLRGVLSLFPKNADRIDVDGERAALADVFDELRSFSMFGGGGSKVVVLRNADDFLTRFREQLEEYVEHPSTSATLVLRLSSLPKNQRIYKAISKHGKVEELSPPRSHELPIWISARAKSAHGAAVSREAAQLLADLIGADLGRLDNELAKLSLMSNDNKIEVETVGQSVAFQREQEMWDMTDMLTAGRTDEAIRRWRRMVQSDSSAEYRASTWLTMWIEKLMKATVLQRQGLNPFVIAKEAKIWPASNVDAVLRAAQRLGERGLARAVDLLAELDKRSKSGLGDAANNVEQFILAMAAK